VNTPTNAHSSSTEAIQFPASSERTYAKASKAWLLGLVLPHPKLRAATKVVATAIYGRFNSDHYYENGGELYAFPGWKELVALTRLSRETINEALKELEEYGLLRIVRGRRLPSGRREHNKYFAIATAPGQKSGPGQGQNSGPSPGQKYRGSPGQENRQEEVRVRIRGESIIGESKPSQNYPDSDSDSKKESLTPERPLRAEEAANGSSGSVAALSFSPPPDVPRSPPARGADREWVRYDTPRWDLLERRGIGRLSRRADGQWIPKSVLKKAIEAATNGGGQ